MEEYYQQYVFYLQHDKKVSRNTLESYTRDTRAFISLLREKSPQEISERDVEDYCSILKAQQKSDATIVRVVASLRSFFGFLHQKGYLESNPMSSVKTQKKNKGLPSILTPKEMAKLLSSPSLDSDKGLRDKAMLELIYATGIRVGELIALSLSDIDLELSVLCCKSEKGSRFIPIYPEALLSVKSYMQNARPNMLHEQTDALFVNMNGARLTRQGFWKIIKNYARESGIEREITPYTLRHSFAEHLYENGASLEDLKGILGHVDIASTKVYAAIAKNRYKDVYARFHPRAAVESKAK